MCTWSGCRPIQPMRRTACNAAERSANATVRKAAVTLRERLANAESALTFRQRHQRLFRSNSTSKRCLATA